jgi:hypothetical protein
MPRYFALLILTTSSLAAHADYCGLYQFEDYGDSTSYTLADFRSHSPQTMNYKIINSDTPVVAGMVNGLCYCVAGDVTQDPAYANNPLFQLIEVKTVTQGPTSDCGPNR